MPTTRHDDSRLHDGMHYPVGHLIGVLRNADEAEQAAQSLYDAGYSDIEVLEGPAAREVIESSERAAHPLARAWARLSTYLSDDADTRQAALDALDQGHAIVMVRAPSAAQQDQAEGILRAHGAHSLAYFGRWAITELGR